MTRLVRKSAALVVAVIGSVSWIASAAEASVRSQAGNREAKQLSLILYVKDPTLDLNTMTVTDQVVSMKRATLESEAEVFGTKSLSALSATAAKRTLWIVHGTAVALTPSERSALLRHPQVSDVQPLGRTARLAISSEERLDRVSDFLAPNPSYTYGLSKIGVPALNQKYPLLDGSGVRVGVIDTGVDARHRDLIGKIAAFKDFVWKKEVGPYDDHGHGTHVSGTIAGGRASGRQIGVAPGAKLVVAKGFTRFGNSKDVDLLEAMQWMADPDGNPATSDAPRVLSCSWNVEGQPEDQDPNANPFCIAIDRLKSLGIVTVFSAGNDGPSSSTVYPPGACPNAVTVGSTNSADGIAENSSRGPVRWKTTTVFKPEISAPGVGIYSAMPNNDYGNKSGTSMATPHVAGALAVLMQAKVGDPVDGILKKLYGASVDLGSRGADEAFGFGRLDLLAAVQFSLR